jgi:hypothetical protein
LNSVIEKPINGILEKAAVEIHTEQYSHTTILIEQNNATGVCHGDSGGPLFIYRYGRSYLQGLAVAVINISAQTESATMRCNGTGLFLNLDFFKVWILKKIAIM